MLSSESKPKYVIFIEQKTQIVNIMHLFIILELKKKNLAPKRNFKIHFEKN